MWQKNNGKSETEILQNQFTAYPATAVQRRRNDSLQQMDRRRQRKQGWDIKAWQRSIIGQCRRSKER